MKLDSILVVNKLDAANSNAVTSVVADIEQWAEAHGVEIILEADAEGKPTEHTLFVAVGGDGTVIHAAKKALEYGAPVLGFNLGKVGFLADFETKKVHSTLHAAFENLLEADERMVIAFTTSNGSRHIALNDLVISPMYSDTTFHYDLFIDRNFAGSHSANGVIVSTPTGSTAYALGVGGAIIMPTADVIQVVPIAAQTLTSRPVIVPAAPGVAIKFPYSESKPIVIRADGQAVHQFSAVGNGVYYHTVKIEPMAKTVKLLHHNSWNHFDVLNKKLNWNK